MSIILFEERDRGQRALDTTSKYIAKTSGVSPINGLVYYVKNINVEKLSNELKTRFSSVKIAVYKDHEDCTWISFFVDFADQADEAAFLLWSSGGIEI